MTKYVVGREPDPSQPHVIVDDKTVSRKHAAISIIGRDRYLLEDLKSANGTYVREKGGWRRIDSEHVGPDDDVRLGTYVTTLAKMLDDIVHTPGRIRIERNPETGEIIKRRDGN
ncbi:FHA domain-containing protein [Rhizobium ruizarguesonis]|uniref:FHA domain-containing protein n=1 Tax=Rhizobium ruizarguesonis TaxID=2081791 RepID=UPI0013E0E389|nr:FHA domain-containing protein [Rhizobium ruizarguesonis]NEJ98817.1 FHA domain-containing protein [Rhizobium ruizarguesonis]